ncbi:unnamed protein product [Lactuca virosa]|uniref:Sulfotransferase n=1 Tax=Lactuca virosa TaxID=75947 RepID=A0AAU9MRF5_9ASTR|nr:unnamed protein product [Lactuca virosa]
MFTTSNLLFYKTILEPCVGYWKASHESPKKLLFLKYEDIKMEPCVGYWKASHESPKKLLFLKYEDIKMEPSMELKKLVVFTGMPFTMWGGGGEMRDAWWKRL